MLDITVVILTFNESKHIERCINSLLGVVSRVVVIDSYSTDNTVELCQFLGATVYQHEWVNYSDQFQWGLDNSAIDTQWTMRMDADEYLEPELIAELKLKLPTMNPGVNGLYLKRKVFFKGKWIRFGGFYPHVLLRLWHTGIGHIEQRWMDEHIVIEKPNTIILDHDIVDDNLNNIEWWTNKHNSYSTREMIDLLNHKYKFMEIDKSLNKTNDPQAKIKRILKEKVYSKLPLGLRPLLYFIYRYFVRLGFLDGGKGFVFHFLQAFWYRLLVDVKVSEVEAQIDIMPEAEIKQIIYRLYGVNIDH
ncbi:glycosyltransferase family 2 protein [Vibrio sp. RC27]